SVISLGVSCITLLAAKIFASFRNHLRNSVVEFHDRPPVRQQLSRVDRDFRSHRGSQLNINVQLPGDLGRNLTDLEPLWAGNLSGLQRTIEQFNQSLRTIGLVEQEPLLFAVCHTFHASTQSGKNQIRDHMASVIWTLPT